MFRKVNRAHRTLSRRERGASLAEFALVLPILLLLVAGVADISRLFQSYIVITNASREGARFASRFPDDEPGIQDAAVQEAAGSGVGLAPGNVTIVGLGAASGQPIEVGVEYFMSTMLSGMIGVNTIPVRVSTVMIVFGLDTP